MPPSFDFVHEFVSGNSGRTLLLLHGTGGNERDLLPLGRALDPAAALLSPRGQVLENGRPRFFRRLAEGIFDLDDLKLRTAQLAEFVKEAAQQYRLDAHRIIAVGYSNGANIAASLLLLRPGLLSSAILFRAMVPLIPESPPDLSGVDVLLLAGDQDPIIPVAETKRLEVLLRKAGAEVELEIGRAGHDLTQADIERAQSWLRTRPTSAIDK
jgi:predicted esterase